VDGSLAKECRMLKLSFNLKTKFIGGIRHMKDFIRNFIESPQLSVVSIESSPGEIVREGAEKLVKMAVMAEFENLLSQYNQLIDQKGKQLIVRNGYHKERNVMTSAGNIRVRKTGDGLSKRQSTQKRCQAKRKRKKRNLLALDIKRGPCPDCFLTFSVGIRI
jgi:hypothetical protein